MYYHTKTKLTLHRNPYYNSQVLQLEHFLWNAFVCKLVMSTVDGPQRWKVLNIFSKGF